MQVLTSHPPPLTQTLGSSELKTGGSMKEIHVWEIIGDNLHNLEVHPIEAVDQTQTEQLLEEILVKKPDLLLPDLRVVGRQTDTPGGPLDLLGVDGDGRLVVFELKRGTLTRDAVAQALDYASFLYDLDSDELSTHISERSGKAGLPKIDNFIDWYTEQFARSFNNSQKPRLVLVGLGADERARRMVSFLANSDLDVSLITFYGFKRDGTVLLARQLDVEAKPPPGGGQKTANVEKLRQRIKRLAVDQYYPAIAKFSRIALRQPMNGRTQAGLHTIFLSSLSPAINLTGPMYLSISMIVNAEWCKSISMLARLKQSYLHAQK
jgi:hypothetical protein